ncbi:MAG: CPBP family intramembrane metalloprotease [Clostridia bacterium]|nr:CPBP family intramembrane metalloprotease [Clostridia bacterium]
MEKNNVNRILHTMTPFLALILTERLLLMLARRLFSEVGDALGLGIFLLAAAFALFLFRAVRYPEEGETDPVPDLIRKRACRCLLHLAAAVAALVTLMFVVAAYMNGESAYSDTASVAGDMPSLSPLSVLSLLLIHPVAEEYLFRRCFYGELRRMNPVFGCMAQAVMFAIMHETVDGMLYALAAGVILGILAEETGRLWPCVAAHMLVNARSLISVTVFAERGGVRYAMDSGILTLGAVAFVILAATRARSASAAERQAERAKRAESRKKQEAGT